MKKEELRKAWLTAAIASGAITGTIFIYALVVEAVARFVRFTPPVSGSAAVALRYGLYLLGVGAVFALRFIRPAMEARNNSAPDSARYMGARALVTATLCEVPALAGFMLFFLTGGYWDFYLLAAFSTAMEIIYFPRYRRWEEKARNAYGLVE
jgi:hypothetical protein